MPPAVWSPRRVRYCCSQAPQGSGTAMATPIVVMVWSLPAEADPVVDVGQRPLRHGAGLLGAGIEDRVELGGVVEQLQRAVAERRDDLHDDVGEVRLQVAVALAVVRLLQVVDAATR